MDIYHYYYYALQIESLKYNRYYFSLLNAATGFYLNLAEVAPDPPDAKMNCAKLILFTGILDTHCYVTRLRKSLSLIQVHHLSCRITIVRTLAPPPPPFSFGRLTRVQIGTLFSSQQTTHRNTEL